MRGLHPVVRLIARLVFGLSVLAAFAFVWSEMATHHFQGAAERAVGRALTDRDEPAGRERANASCRWREGDRERVYPCDPIEAGAERSLRSTSCTSSSLLRLVGGRWHCVARFSDGVTLEVDVSLGVGGHRLELLLPVRAPDAHSPR